MLRNKVLFFFLNLTKNCVFFHLLKIKKNGLRKDRTRARAHARTRARTQASQRNTEYGLLGKTNTAGKSFRDSYQMSDFSMAAAAQQDHARLSDHEREVLKSNSEESARTPLVRAVLKKASCKFWKRLCCYCMA